ncbi:alpha/beta fold hydrolase [Streptomyces sp. AV19]|uniref:alpha/beta fold hydrolase n=1 Tax=Streptomyces sp. AV19 TaxID=2793068 RepID=UPI0018FE4D7E|nr:alpha/beta fold hydrolase [Streptomyces sp. AV19]MBH1933527.1 alpha/beta fold hydrolase [Streptomyces sp. AV19]MDG4532181.1 alpha/beta hydrolase [Streptomyces sp. AV19]
MPYATTPDGARIAHQLHPGDGPPLVLLAGQANNHHWWDGIRDDFHTSRSTLTLDYRGTGASDAPEAPYSTRELARDVIAVLDTLGIDRADVYGTSMGGRVAQWVAADHPDRVRRLVLGCTTPGGRHAVAPDPAVHRSLATRDSRRALLDLMYTPKWRATHPGPYRTLGDPHMSPRSRTHHRTASRGHDAWDALPSITAPTLVLHGTDDVFNPAANAPLLADRIPGARLETIPGARHAYFEEFREVAGALVLDFLG